MYHENKKGGRILGLKEALSRFLDVETEVWRGADRLFPVRITQSWAERSKSIHGPLGVQAFPNRQELYSHPNDLQDPVGESTLSPVPWVIVKHSDRALLLVTKRCHLYCRYCFRRAHDGAQDPTKSELQHALQYINSGDFQETILSGGDPLAVSNTKLDLILQTVQTPIIRIHTRAPVTAPFRVTDELVSVLQKRKGTWVIIHCNHPDELSDEVIKGIKKFQLAGIPVLNQAVLLRGVNDEPAVLKQLFLRLVELQIFPYYLHHTDAVSGNAKFRVSLQRGLQIWEEVAQEVSGIALPRYVIDPADGSGRIDVRRYIGVLHGKAQSNSQV